MDVVILFLIIRVAVFNEFYSIFNPFSICDCEIINKFYMLNNANKAKRVCKKNSVLFSFSFAVHFLSIVWSWLFQIIRKNIYKSFFCLQERIPLTAEPIRFSFTFKLLIGPEKVYSYFCRGYVHPTPQPPEKIPSLKFILLFCLKLK